MSEAVDKEVTKEDEEVIKTAPGDQNDSASSDHGAGEGNQNSDTKKKGSLIYKITPRHTRKHVNLLEQIFSHRYVRNCNKESQTIWL